MNEKITSKHLSRRAYVYIRQSTLGQLQRNVESRRVQERLVERARDLGWPEACVIDEDLGSTASGAVARAGFERLLAEVCAGEVGAIFAFEASRLARNGREWHTLLEICAVVDTLLVDTEAVYDVKLSNDRLLLGLKGTLSELELGLFRARSHAAMREKAKRGELFLRVAVGYRKVKNGRLEKDPDLRIQRAIEFVFEKFPQFGSARQLVRWLREEQVRIPRNEKNRDDSAIVWCLPTQAAITGMLRNPVYAGAYVFGRTKHQTVLEQGRKRILKRACSEPDKWEILIRDNHPGYISWEQYQRNVEMLRQNVNMKGMMCAGGIRGGASVFAGILRCGECGRKVLVNYSGTRAQSIRYSCNTNCRNDDGRRCLSFSANALEGELTRQVIEVVEPHGVEAALQTIEKLNSESLTLREQRELALEQARYESHRAWQQYNAIDPVNRLVASELERRWNATLEAVAKLEEELGQTAEEEPVTTEERAELLELGENLKAVWDDPETPAELRKRIVRILVKEVVLYADAATVKAIVHWQGGVHTEVKIPRRTSRDNGVSTESATLEIIRASARQMPDRLIASLLNRLQLKTARGLSWNEARVRAIRHGHEIPPHQEGERQERGELNVLEAAKEFNVERYVIAELIKTGLLPATQVCKYAPWVIRRCDIQSTDVQRAIEQRRLKRPCVENQNQLSLEFQ